MTLILTVANGSGIHQCSDFALTDPRTGLPVADSAGTKQLKATFGHLDVVLAFTGLARVGSRHTIDWLSDELKALPATSELQDVCEALQRRNSSEIGKPGLRHHVLTIVLATAEIGEPYRVATISNADWTQSPPTAKTKFEIQIHTVRKPLHLISGYRAAVPHPERRRLKALAKGSSTEVAAVQDVLVSINSNAAKNSNGWISENCWVESLYQDGQVVRSSARNIGEREGFIHGISGGFDISEWVRSNIRAAPGQTLRQVQRVGAVVAPGGFGRIPPPQGEPRQFRLSGGSSTVPLLTPKRERCATLTLTRLQCSVEARLNEEIILPFAEVQVTDPQIGDAFARPLFPWPYLDPELFLDGTPVPNGFHHSVCHWIDGDGLQVSLPRVSMGIRKIAFLGDDDELVLALVDDLHLTLTRGERLKTGTLSARIHWRVRMDGTSG
jgi:hypothetical protein